PYLWWKRYITRLQLIQFAILIGCIFWGLMHGWHRDLDGYPLPMILLGGFQPFVFFYMFSNCSQHLLHIRFTQMVRVWPQVMEPKTTPE
ncbi:unnamed protein product, partial [Oppiella nova]